jgi:hypothetical protein
MELKQNVSSAFEFRARPGAVWADSDLWVWCGHVIRLIKMDSIFAIWRGQGSFRKSIPALFRFVLKIYLF